MGTGRIRGSDVDPRWYERLVGAEPIARLRSPKVRMIAAGALTLLALVLLIRPDPAAKQVTVVLATGPLAPGTELSAADLRVATVPATAQVPGAVRDPDQIIGATLAAALAEDEQVTELRVLGPPLARAAAGIDEARLVPIRPADATITDLVRAGDRVDVIVVADPADTRAGGATDADADADDHPGTDRAVPAGDGGPAAAGRVLATGAPVVLVPGSDGSGPVRDRVILVALPADRAVAVAAASLTEALTVTVH